MDSQEAHINYQAEREMWAGLAACRTQKIPESQAAGLKFLLHIGAYWKITPGRKKDPDFEGSFMLSYGI